MRTLSILGVIVVSVMFLARPSMADPDRRLALIKDCQHMLRQIPQLPGIRRVRIAGSPSVFLTGGCSDTTEHFPPLMQQCIETGLQRWVTAPASGHNLTRPTQIFPPPVE